MSLYKQVLSISVCLWLVDRRGCCIHEKNCCWLWLTFRQTVCESSSLSLLSSSQDYTNPDDQPTTNIDSSGYRHFTVLNNAHVQLGQKSVFLTRIAEFQARKTFKEKRFWFIGYRDSWQSSPLPPPPPPYGRYTHKIHKKPEWNLHF